MGQQAEAILHETEAHDAHHEMSFWDKYIFSVDHKIIGFQYMSVSYTHLTLPPILLV